MSYNEVRTKVGIGFFLFHLFVLIGCIFLKMTDRFDDLTLAISLAILAPLLAHYSSRIFEVFLRTKHEFAKGRHVNSRYSVVIFWALCFFILFISGVIAKQAIRPSSILNFTEILGSAEVLFGIYIAAIFRDLFGQI